MGKRIWICKDDGECVQVLAGGDDSTVLTALGRKRLDELVASAPASKTVVGTSPPNGDVIITAFHGGTAGQAIGYVAEDGPLDVYVSGKHVHAVFPVGTSAQEVADAINADAEAAELIIAAAGGDGLADAAHTGLTYLEGGDDSGSLIKYPGSPPVLHRVTRIESF